MKRHLVNTLKFAVSAAIIAWLIHKARQDPQFDELLSGGKDWPALFAATLLSLAAVVVTIVRWYYLVRALQLPFRMRDAMRLGFLGYLFNFVSLGSVGGDLFKAVFIAREQPGRRTEAVATVVLDRIIGLYGLFVVATLAVLLTGQLHSTVPEVQVICKTTLVATAVGGIAVLMVLTPGFTSGTVSEMLARIPRVGPHLDRLIRAVRIYRRKPGVLALSLLLSLGVHALSAGSVYLIARGLPEVAPPLSDHFVMVPLANLTGVLPLPMSGLGAFEAALEFLYRHLPDGTAAAPNKGLVTALGYRVITMLIATIGVAYYLRGRREVSDALHDAEAAEGDGSEPTSGKAEATAV